MPAKIKLVYFNAKGRAELSRLILAQAGVEYDDVRFEREEWPVHKQSKTFLQKWANPGLIVVYFRSFHIPIQKVDT